ncbi:histidine phosphatase family protein [Streptomyces sp. 6N223]|uniref:histidine phosphatase family protein n=1 Tax=Streptomyces sp. 6N223 TaxID=3457412 RepID=UPI003FCFECEB
MNAARWYIVQHGEKEKTAGDPGLTALGRRQAALTGRWLASLGLRGPLLSSPLRRARETAEAIAAETGLAVREDARLRERMNWDGSLPFAHFLADWERTVRDRDFAPRIGDSSRRAAERFLACLTEPRPGGGPFAVVTHGGVTVDALRTLLGDEYAVDPELVRRGVPSCALTMLEPAGRGVVEIASVRHLS